METDQADADDITVPLPVTISNFPHNTGGRKKKKDPKGAHTAHSVAL